LNNFSYDSTGGQPTVATNIKFCGIAKAVGYTYAAEVKTREELVDEIKHLDKIDGPAFLVVYVKKGSRGDLGRPTVPLIELKREFMGFLGV
jgi:phosphonopyruvate decarboxylase